LSANLTDEELRRLRLAYQLFGLPTSSSAVEIKRAFRSLAKTWHPDKWPAGTPQQEKAAERMRELNAAYEAVRHAPLRYHIEGHPRVAARAAEAGRPVRRESVPVTDRGEWVVRFVFGALFGCVVNLFVMCGAPSLSPALWVVVPVACGLGSAYLGDAFWSTALELVWWI
jgi:DnaJ-class molecular chaperone